MIPFTRKVTHYITRRVNAQRSRQRVRFAGNLGSILDGPDIQSSDRGYRIDP